MVHVMRRAIDEQLQCIGNIVIPVVDGDCPDIDEHEQSEVGVFVQRKQKWVYMIWPALKKSIQGMESVTGKWRGHFPAMVVFVEVFVNRLVVKETVDPVYKHVSEQDEGHHANGDAQPAWNEMIQ